jgi:flagellar basal body-associated protein FliL
MKEVYIPKEKIPRVVYLALLFVAGALIILLLIGTIVGLVRPQNASPLFALRKIEQTKPEDIRVYSGLERLRIPLSNSSTLILSVSFPYSAKDITFTEELAAKIGDFKAIITEYFSSLPEENVNQIDEETAKQEILRSFNANLRLGRISTIYFNDMTLIESGNLNSY